MRDFVSRCMRHRGLQPLWQWLHGVSLVGMNFWANQLTSTGELQAARYVARKLSGTRRPVIFDVGANIGDFSEFCCETFGDCEVHAFEPSLATYEMLTNNLKRAKVDAQTHYLGFSDAERDARLYSSEPGSTIASLHELQRPIRPFRDELTEVVRLTTIDAFCHKQGIERIDYLKLDIEGHEYYALRGANRMLAARLIRFIQFEFGDNNVSSRTYLDDFERLLGESYRIYRIVPGGLVPWNYGGGRSEIFATMNYLCERRD